MKHKLLKTAKILGFIAIALVTLAALALAIENYRGKRAWEACRAEFAAKGEPLDWAALAPPPVPDDQNFWKTPLLRPLSDMVIDRATGLHRLRDTNAPFAIAGLFDGLDLVDRLKLGSWRLGQVMNLMAMQDELRNQTNTASAELKRLLTLPRGTAHADLLALIGMQAGPLEEIRSALARPHARYGVPIEDGAGVLLFQLGPPREFAQVFQRRALANLAAGNADAAAADVLASLRLARTLESEPLLICTLVEVAVLETAMQPLWEGLARRQWNEQHLVALDAELARFDFVAGMARTLRFERAYSLATLDGWTRRPKAGGATGTDGDSGLDVRPSRFPSGWIRLTQVEFARMFQDFLIPVMDTNRMVVDVELGNRLEPQAEKRLKGWPPYKVLARMLYPAIGKAWHRAAQAQTTVNQARIAIALERFRLAEDGSFPEQLPALAPRFIHAVPHDVLGGEPYRYRREAPDRFVLYSVGLNLKDDGGEVAVTKTGRPNTSAFEGDWVWRSTIAER